MSSLVADFGALDFSRCLEDFLRRSAILPKNFATIHECTRFAVFKRITVELPHSRKVTTGYSTTPKDTICATQPQPSKGLTKGVPGQFDTILTRNPKPLGHSSVRKLSGESNLWFELLMLKQYL